MSGKTRRKFPQQSDELDLVPLIDVTFLVLLFFILCGRLTIDQRAEQITVPPTRTAMTMPKIQGWERVVINVFGSTQRGGAGAGSIARNSLQISPNPAWQSQGVDDYTGYQRLRTMLNQVHDKAEKYPDPKGTGIQLPKVVIEIRADAETEYRVVQEVQQVISDTIDPFNNMLPRNVKPTDLKTFVNIDFTTRKPGEN
jgi:biopolymer transport protein ExbD